MGPAQIDKADRWFQSHGELAVMFGRMIPVVRAFISLPAGLAKMHFWRFTVFSLIGAVPWVLGLALAGEALGGRMAHRAQGLRVPRLRGRGRDRGRDRLCPRPPPADAGREPAADAQP